MHNEVPVMWLIAGGWVEYAEPRIPLPRSLHGGVGLIWNSGNGDRIGTDHPIVYLEVLDYE